MSDPTRGITCPDMRRIVREAMAAGWEWAGWSGTTHAAIRWPTTGTVLSFGATPSVASWKSLATDIQKASGCEVWRKGNRKRSRKAEDHTDFSIDTAMRELAAWHLAHDPGYAALRDERELLIDECFALVAEDTRDSLAQLPSLWHRIGVLEDKLIEHYRQPIERFDPRVLVAGGAA